VSFTLTLESLDVEKVVDVFAACPLQGDALVVVGLRRRGTTARGVLEIHLELVLLK
jgi:hypothetical protein